MRTSSSIAQMTDPTWRCAQARGSLGILGTTPARRAGGSWPVRDRSGIGTEAYDVHGERRWATIGATQDGPILFVVFTRRGRRVRVIATSGEGYAGYRAGHRHRRAAGPGVGRDDQRGALAGVDRVGDER